VTESTADAATEAVPPPRRPVVAAVVLVAGLVLAVMTGVTSYGIAHDEGDGSSGVGTILVWALLPAAVIAMGLRLTLQAFWRRTVGWARLLLVAYVISVLAVGIPTVAASNEHRAAEPGGTPASGS
jgi:TRAP-type C4-dicarboxylate transport system permease small subunit